MKTNVICLGVLLIWFISCDLLSENEQVELYNDFTHELSDDVSPLKVTFKADGDWAYTRWTIDNYWMTKKIDKNTREVFFEEPGFHEVNFEGWRDHKYIGTSSIQIPPPATKISIEGFYFDDSKDLEFLKGKELNIETSYFNQKEHNQVQENIVLVETDTVIFNDPDLFFEEHIANEDVSMTRHVDITISEIGTDNRLVFGTFYIYESYMIDRLSFGNYIRLKNLKKDAEIKSITLLVDWLP